MAGLPEELTIQTELPWDGVTRFFFEMAADVEFGGMHYLLK
jgi:hypothetical protein